MRNYLCTASVLLALASSTVLAAEPLSDAAMREHCKSVMTQAKAARAEFLPERVTRESESHASRIRILQDADVCIHAAKDPQDYRACEEKEGATRKAWKEENQAARAALKAKYAPLLEQINQCRSWRAQQRPGPSPQQPGPR